MEQIHILIAEPSDVIRKGLCSILTAAGSVRVSVTEVCRAESLRDIHVNNSPDIFIISPGFSTLMPPSAIKKMFPDARCVMLRSWPGDCPTAHLWDDVVSPWDSAAEIREQILRTGHDSACPVRRHGPLSGREKDIVVCVVKGMTNMQIADKLHLSHHTVGTHRRNISTKLDIHSTSGLTVYAISNNLVRLDDL